MSIVINGRFLTGPETGVQRVAANLILSVDRLLAERGAGRDWLVRAPRGTKRRLPLSAIDFRAESVLRGQAWEQVELPWAAERAALVNLCNIGPVMAPSAVSLIHDAQVFLSPHSYSPAFARWYRLALPRLAARSRQVATVSEFSRRMLARFGVAPIERIHVLSNGVDHMLDIIPDAAVLERLGLLSRVFVFAFGSLQPHKNLGHLLRVFSDPRLRDVTLVVSGALDQADVERAAGVPTPGNVRLAGRLSDSEIRSLLEHAACLLCPSTTEGFGLPPLEAMILGCPAIVAPTGALPEVCGQAATYADLEDLRAWVEAILEIVADAGGREVRRVQARVHASAYTWRRSAERLHAMVLEAA